MVAKRRYGSLTAAPVADACGSYDSDTVAKVILHWWSEILRAADEIFV
jgi:hypothetical protein